MAVADFRINGRVEHAGPRQFLAIASAVPNRPGAVAAQADVRLQLLPDREGAKLARDILVNDLGEALRLRGDRVINVDTD
jgi:hypothetical protein